MIMTIEQMAMVAVICILEPGVLMGTAWLVIKIKRFMRKEEE